MSKIAQQEPTGPIHPVPTAEYSPEPSNPLLMSRWRPFANLVAAADDVATASDVDAMLKHAVEKARSVIGLERVAFFLKDPSADGILMRGTWGTGAQGDTVDEHNFFYECSLQDYERLRQVPGQGRLWEYQDNAPQIAEESHRPVVIGRGWLATTPLVSGGELVGVMFNDTALSQRRINEDQQAEAAMFCGMLAGLFRAKRPLIWQRSATSPANPGPTIAHVLDVLQREPHLTGQTLAARLEISAGHLARLFKKEMGMSLVEYRNRLRLDRFFRVAENNPRGLTGAALDAGFGSYAQFRRVYRSITGESPRDFLSKRKKLVSP